MTKNSTDEVVWSSEQQIQGSDDRRIGIDRRQYTGRCITVPDMRARADRRSGKDRRNKLRLTITGRAMDV